VQLFVWKTQTVAVKKGRRKDNWKRRALSLAHTPFFADALAKTKFAARSHKEPIGHSHFAGAKVRVSNANTHRVRDTISQLAAPNCSLRALLLAVLALVSLHVFVLCAFVEFSKNTTPRVYGRAVTDTFFVQSVSLARALVSLFSGLSEFGLCAVQWMCRRRHDCSGAVWNNVSNNFNGNKMTKTV
jgi:hypothetical protein